MATTLPYKYYAHDGIIEPWATTNAPYAGSGFQEVSQQDFINWAKSTPGRDSSLPGDFKGTMYDVYQRIQPDALTGQSSNVAEYIHPLTGEKLTNVPLSAIQQLEAQQAGIQAGTLKDLGGGMTVPINSAAVANIPNIGTQNTAQAANLEAYKKAFAVDKVLGASVPVVPGTGASTNYNALLAGALAAGGATGGVLPEQAQYDATQNSILAKLKELEGQAGYQLQQEAQFGVAQKKQDLLNAQTALNALNAEAASEAARIEGRPLAMGAISGQQGNVERMRAAKALSLSAQIQALQGNLELAIEQANRATELKYEGIKAQLETLKTTLQLNYDNLTRAEKKQADALKIVADAQKDKLDAQAAKDKTMETLFMTALSNGASTALITKARALYQAGQQDQAVSLVSGYTGPKNYGTGTGGTSQPGENSQLYAGLSSATATAVRAKVSQFKSEPIIQNFATVQEGKNFASSLSNTTTNPADDQALIYALAKALDPGSVVREGEYATAQKYAQSWISAYGKGVEQALLGTGFLSETARKNIKSTIDQKYASALTSYNNLYGQYASGINNLTGRSDGKDFIVDYAVTQKNNQQQSAPNFLLTGGGFNQADPLGLGTNNPLGL